MKLLPGKQLCLYHLSAYASTPFRAASSSLSPARYFLIVLKLLFEELCPVRQKKRTGFYTPPRRYSSGLQPDLDLNSNNTLYAPHGGCEEYGSDLEKQPWRTLLLNETPERQSFPSPLRSRQQSNGRCRIISLFVGSNSLHHNTTLSTHHKGSCHGDRW